MIDVRKLPLLTTAVIAACVGISIALQLEPDLESWDALRKYGYVSPIELRSGALQGLIGPMFVHFEFWHLLLNMYWLWVLGSALERTIGPLKYALFLLGSGVVSSLAQLALSDDTGIGASGVVYAIFGYIWVASPRREEFSRIIDRGIVKLFVAWLVVCIVATYAGILYIANAAHIGGLVFGMGVAALFELRYRPALVGTGLAMLCAGLVSILFWCPWSPSWLGTRAYEAHLAKRYEEALDRYSQLIELNPADEWAYSNRGMVYSELGDQAAAEADWDRAGDLDPRPPAESGR